MISTRVDRITSTGLLPLLVQLRIALIASYGRDQERQADEVGQKMANFAGYDPDGMATFLDALDHEVTLKLGGESRRPSFLDSHPATPERVASASARARTLGTTGVLAAVPARDAFVARLDGILIDEDPAEGLVQEQAFVHPDLDLRIVFPDGWQVQNGGPARGRAGARGRSADPARRAGARQRPEGRGRQVRARERAGPARGARSRSAEGHRSVGLSRARACGALAGDGRRGAAGSRMAARSPAASASRASRPSPASYRPVAGVPDYVLLAESEYICDRNTAVCI